MLLLLNFFQIFFFCGMDPVCDIFGSPEALKIAKANVERYYSVVGVLEKFNETLEVLENYVPAFFKDARKIYKNMMNDRSVNQFINQNKFKKKPNSVIKELVKVNFTTEIEFFNFCKQRLYRQLLTITLK